MDLVQPQISVIYYKQREQSGPERVLEKEFSKPYLGFRRRFRWICTYPRIDG